MTYMNFPSVPPSMGKRRVSFAPIFFAFCSTAFISTFSSSLPFFACRDQTVPIDIDQSARIVSICPFNFHEKMVLDFHHVAGTIWQPQQCSNIRTVDSNILRFVGTFDAGTRNS
ncbi:MAG: hypothetical protein WBC90_12025 [Albidovulum sp.]